MPHAARLRLSCHCEEGEARRGNDTVVVTGYTVLYYHLKSNIFLPENVKKSIDYLQNCDMIIMYVYAHTPKFVDIINGYIRSKT